MINDLIVDMIDSHVENTKGSQMTKEEYLYIARFLHKSNYLVFGTGGDTPIWREANKGGVTVFLESNKKWIRSKDTDVFKVKYTSNRSQYISLLNEFNEGCYDNLRIDLPDFIFKTKWDYILVDAPAGTTDKKPGRMQSIFMSSILSDNSTETFIHDCDRVVEDLYSMSLFTTKVKDLNKLRHVKK